MSRPIQPIEHFYSKAFLQKLRTKECKKNGFTLIELMVVVAIVGVLSTVTLPALTQAQNRGKASAAKQESVNAAKTYTFALIGGVAAEITVAVVTAVATGDITTPGANLADDAAFAFTGGGETWTTTLIDGVAGSPQ